MAPSLDNLDEDYLSRLRSAIWYTVGQIVDQQTEELGCVATPQFIASLAEFIFSQAQTMGQDLESFSRHAKRSVITVDDVRMLYRRNEHVGEIMDSFIQQEIQKKNDKN